MSVAGRVNSAIGPKGWNNSQKSITAAYVLIAGGLLLSQGLYDKLKGFVTRQPAQTHTSIAAQGSANAGPPVQGGSSGAQTSYMCPDCPNCHTYHVCKPGEGPTPANPTPQSNPTPRTVQ